MLKKIVSNSRKLALACAALIAAASIAYAGGAFQGWPLIGGSGTTNCLSTGNNGVCNQFQPAGPSVLTGNETIPADTNIPGGGSNANPATVVIPSNLFGNGYGNTTIFSTTGTTAAVVVADGVSNFVYTGAGAATFTSFKLAANPINNQLNCLVDAGTGVLTLTAVAASANSFGNTPTIVGTTPTSLPVMTATGTVVGTSCWLYQAGASNNGIWYRTL